MIDPMRQQAIDGPKRQMPLPFPVLFPMKGDLFFTVCGILMLCVPSAKWIAYLVEKKKHTFSIGGASFCGLVAMPLVLLALQPIVSL